MACRGGRFVLLLGAFLGAQAHGYGVDGHLIAGTIAETYLCPAARSEVATLGGGERLGELGLWADRVRSVPEYEQSAPWHYMNVEDGGSIARFRHPPEGDVLWAVEHFHDVLGDRSRTPEERGEALKFLVHFVVDLHQPLHVGRASDRGGNAIELRVGGAPTNLHRFWDTDAIELAGMPSERYLELVASRVDLGAVEAAFDPRAWAEESLALRAEVYDFDRRGRTLTGPYIDFAIRTTEERLALAAARLAATLNGLFCD